MKQIGLIQLTLNNFKGIKNFVLEAGGQPVSVLGDNGVGKTTLFDAFTWLLFDKDSQNKKDFGIKTLDKSGKAFSELEHEVEGVLMVGNKRKTLRKVYAEKWTKKRGSATAELTGHETTYFVDGIPVKKGEYTDCIGELINESIFKLLTSPTYFNEGLHWQERRQILLEVCGNVTDADVIASSKELLDLTAILGERSLDDHRKVIGARRGQISKELDGIAIRINEAQRAVPDVDGIDEEFLEDDIASVRARIDEKTSEMSRIQSGGEIAVKERQIHEITTELLQLKNELQGGVMDKITAQRSLVNRLSTDINNRQQKIENARADIARNAKSILRYEQDAALLREKWTVINGEQLEHKHGDNCPACGQSLPEEQKQTAHEKALTEFNRRKAERLTGISRDGKAAAAEVSRLKAENEQLGEVLTIHVREYEAADVELNKQKSELDKLQANMSDPTTDPAYIKKTAAIEVLKKEITGLRSASISALDKVRMELSQLRTDLERMDRQKAGLSQAKVAAKRIEEIKQQEKALINEFEKLEREFFLTEEFIRTKVTMLESKINNKFRSARFKLFEQQINGGVTESCETTFAGVPYSGGLNNAARINVGLDIINTLSEHFGYTAPIFIDNAEAVTRLIETAGQQISLIVSEQDKQLRVEAQHIKEAV